MQVLEHGLAVATNLGRHGDRIKCPIAAAESATAAEDRRDTGEVHRAMLAAASASMTSAASRRSDNFPSGSRHADTVSRERRYVPN